MSDLKNPFPIYLMVCLFLAILIVSVVLIVMEDFGRKRLVTLVIPDTIR